MRRRRRATSGAKRPWYKLPHHDPRRIGMEYRQATAQLRRLRADIKAASSELSAGEELIEELYGIDALPPAPSPVKLEHARARVDMLREIWEAAGQPDERGVKHAGGNRKRLALLVAQRIEKKHALPRGVTVDCRLGDGSLVEWKTVTSPPLRPVTVERIERGLERYRSKHPAEFAGGAMAVGPHDCADLFCNGLVHRIAGGMIVESCPDAKKHALEQAAN